MKLKIWQYILIGGFILLMLFSGQAVSLYTELMWFIEVGYQQVFLKVILTQVVLGLLMGAFFLVFTGFNFFIAGKSKQLEVRVLANNVIEIPDLSNVRMLIQKFAWFGIITASLLITLSGHLDWESFLNFVNGVKVGVVDPLFNVDLGFYLFKLPFLQSLYGRLTIMLIITTLLVIGVYFVRGNVQFRGRGISFSAQARNHIWVLASLMFILKAAGYKLDIYNLMYSVRGVVYGATYADVHAQLPAINLCFWVSLIIAFLFIVDLFLRKWLLPVTGIGVLLLTSILGVNIYPEIVQKFRVTPNEINMETPYITQNIESTRMAYNLDKIVEKPFSADQGLSMRDIRKNSPTIDNIRLWDHRPLLSTFSQLQEIRTYYSFESVDNDRYTINDKYRQVMISGRELDHNKLSSKIWINEHLTYTHGYGFVMSPVNEVTDEGLPKFMVRDIPPVSGVDIEIDRPEIYYGNLANDYIIANTMSKELDYPSGDKNVYTSYEGNGGVRLDSIIKKIVYAVRFGSLKILLSRDITSDSRILYYRKVDERVRKVTSLIRYDGDPYLVVSGGRLYWIIDGYTITDRYPYSQPFSKGINYIRNSVKAVVDAYDGKMNFYVSDPEDPLIRTYGRIFPSLFHSLADMPQDLLKHIRYPRDMFSIQCQMFSTYHMTDPQVFYNKEDIWAIPNEIFRGMEEKMEPYYTIMRLPEEEKEEYMLMQPFTPIRRDNMISWMAARSDFPHYGGLVVYRFPKEKLIYGPMQIEARIDQDAYISQQFTLWGQGGSQIIRGNLLVIPVEKSLLYVEPVYLQAERGRIPELRRVIVAFGDRLVMERTLEEALNSMFTGTGYKKDIKTEPGVNEGNLNSIAWEHFQRAKRYQKEGNWKGYGEELSKLEDVLRRMKK